MKLSPIHPSMLTEQPELTGDALIVLRELQTIERRLGEIERLAEAGQIDPINVHIAHDMVKDQAVKSILAIAPICHAFTAAMGIDGASLTMADEAETWAKFRAWLRPARSLGDVA